jgi:phage portal protein BeeE
MATANHAASTETAAHAGATEATAHMTSGEATTHVAAAAEAAAHVTAAAAATMTATAATATTRLRIGDQQTAGKHRGTQNQHHSFQHRTLLLMRRRIRRPCLIDLERCQQNGPLAA